MLSILDDVLLRRERERFMIRAGLHRLGVEAVTIGLAAFAHPRSRSFCNCFLGCIVLGDLSFTPHDAACPTVDAQQLVQEIGRAVYQPWAFDSTYEDEQRQMARISDAFERKDTLLDEEIERLLGFSIEDGLRVIYGKERFE